MSRDGDATVEDVRRWAEHWLFDIGVGQDDTHGTEGPGGFRIHWNLDGSYQLAFIPVHNEKSGRPPRDGEVKFFRVRVQVEDIT